MQLIAEIERALAELAKSGPLEVHENGRRLPGLTENLSYEVRPQGAAPLLHLWSESEGDAQSGPQSDARNIVRRVVGIAEDSAEHLSLEIQPFRARASVRRERFGANRLPSGASRFCKINLPTSAWNR